MWRKISLVFLNKIFSNFYGWFLVAKKALTRFLHSFIFGLGNIRTWFKLHKIKSFHPISVPHSLFYSQRHIVTSFLLLLPGHFTHRGPPLSAGAVCHDSQWVLQTQPRSVYILCFYVCVPMMKFDASSFLAKHLPPMHCGPNFGSLRCDSKTSWNFFPSSQFHG